MKARCSTPLSRKRTRLMSRRSRAEHNKIGRQPPSLARSVGHRSVRKTIVVFCEGTTTEPAYIGALKKDPDVRDLAAVDIRIETADCGAVPLTLVQRACELRAKAIAENAEIDEIWCIFDVEWPTNHPKLADAVRQARDNDIRLAISNPTFELWLILHFRDYNAWLDNDRARQIRRACDHQPGKNLDPADYMPLRHDAARRAIALDRAHERNGTRFPHDNPSSGMHGFVQSVSPNAGS